MRGLGPSKLIVDANRYGREPPANQHCDIFPFGIPGAVKNVKTVIFSFAVFVVYNFWQRF